MTNARMDEIVRKLGAAAGEETKSGRFTAPDIAGNRDAGTMYAIRVNMNLPEALVAAGITVNSQEAEEFLSQLVGGYVLAMFTPTKPQPGEVADLYQREGGRHITPSHVIQSVLGTGYLIGLAAAGHKGREHVA